MTAAALLRRLDAEATGGPWIVDGLRDGYVTGADCNICDQPGPAYDGHRAWPANARAICTTRNLLPLLAGVVEVASDVVASLDALSKAEPHQKLEAAKVSVGAHEVLRQRLAALEAAAKEVV